MSSPRVEFELRPDEPGWLRISLDLHGESREEWASWQTDAIADLLDQAWQLASFDKPEFGLIRVVRFLQEPGLSTWEMELFKDRSVELRARSTDGERDPPVGEPWVMRSSALDWAIAIRDASVRLLAKHGLTGYLDLWALHEFPTARLLRLIDSIETFQGRPTKSRTLAAEAAWLASLVTHS